ncbi:hypothetical protein Tco_1523052 [Tanacetum coccineum]
MSAPKFANSHNMVAFLAKPTESDRFEQILDFLNANPIKYALMSNLYNLYRWELNSSEGDLEDSTDHHPSVVVCCRCTLGFDRHLIGGKGLPGYFIERGPVVHLGGHYRGWDGPGRFRCSRSVFSDRLPPTLPQVYREDMDHAQNVFTTSTVEEEVVIETTQKHQRLLKFQRDLLVVVGGWMGGVEDEVESPDGVLLENSPEPRCSIMWSSLRMVGFGFPHSVVKNFFHISFWQVSEAFPEWRVHSPVNSIRDYFIHSFAHLIGNVLILQPVQSCTHVCLIFPQRLGGRGMVVRIVVVIVVAVAAMVVGKFRCTMGESGTETRSITGEVMGGITKRRQRPCRAGRLLGEPGSSNVQLRFS